jgi:glucose-6-phosphate dehydrogenase assembly protein OpcA
MEAPVSDLETFERGGAIEVPVARIEAELSALWRAAASSSKAAVTRACLWNFIVRSASDEDFQYAKQLIDDISQRVPARVIVLCPRPSPADEEGRIQAWVEANWRRGGHGASGSDEVTLHATGKSVERLVSLVRSLVITDVPTAMMWIGPPPAEGAPVRGLLKESERLVVDSRKFPSEAGLSSLARLWAAYPDLEVVDLSWLGISPIRGLGAAFFDHDPAPLMRLERVRVTSGVQGTQARALLLLGWLGSLLGWHDYRRMARSDESGGRRWQAARGDGKGIEIELVTDRSGAQHGVKALELTAGSDEWSLGRGDVCIDVRGPGLPQRLQPARSHSDAELTVTALGPRGRDPVFRASLEHAAGLVES